MVIVGWLLFVIVGYCWLLLVMVWLLLVGYRWLLLVIILFFFVFPGTILFLLLYTLWHYYNTLFITVHIMALYSFYHCSYTLWHYTLFITVLLPMRKWVK